MIILINYFSFTQFIVSKRYEMYMCTLDTQTNLIMYMCTLIKPDVLEVAGCLQMCAGHDSGCEAAVHCIRK